jgi:ankyrin repeat protein
MVFTAGTLRLTWVLPLLVLATVAAASDQPVVDAARRGDVQTIRVLIAQNVNVNVPQPDGATALHWAAYRGDVEAVELLVAAGAKVNAANEYGATPLFLACQNSNAQVVSRLLAAGADANAALPEGETLLMTAAQSGSVEVVNALMARGAAIDARESNMGQTALMWAIAEGHRAVVKALVEAGADVTTGSQDGFTPYLFAARAGNIEMAKYLASKGADPAGTTKDGTTALHIAVVRGHLPFAKHLLALGADPNASGPGYTVLHWAAGTFESIFSHEFIFSPQAAELEKEWSVLAGVPTFEAKADLIKALLSHGADIDAVIKRPPPRFGGSIFPAKYLMGATPFYLAAVSSDVPVMRLLLAEGADPMMGANDGTTPLIAVALARVDSETMIPEPRLVATMQLCMELGHDVNAANGAGTTAMHAAALQGLDAVTQFLYDNGAEVNPKNMKGETPTKIADGYESAGMVYTRPSTAALLRTLGGVAE